MKVLITGAVGSGTTFVANIFREMGAPMGDGIDADNHRNTDRQIRGLEHIPLVELMLSWSVQFLPVVRKGQPRYARNLLSMLALDSPAVSRLVKPQVAEVANGLPEVVKCPLMLRWFKMWLMSGGMKDCHWRLQCD